MQSTLDKSSVAEMFNYIAPDYDFLNHFLTMGIDIAWRKKTIARIDTKEPHPVIVDVATGTADLAIAMAKALDPARILAVDFSEQMLNKAQIKIQHAKLDHLIDIQKENGEAMTLPDACADVVTIGFGIRNFMHPDRGLSEFYRILKHGGQVVVLEFSQVKPPMIRALFSFYFKHILPFVGRLVSKHPSAYSYLPESVEEFAQGDVFAQMMRQAGFESVDYKPLSFGIATIYWGYKR